MKSIVIRLSILAGLVATVPPLAAQPSPAATLFHQALLLERADGKVQDAIFRYERVIAEFPSDREVVPQVLYHLAQLYQRAKDPRATLLLTRLVTEYPNANPYAADARTALVAWQASPAGPFRSVAAPTLDFQSASPDGQSVVYHKDQNRGRLYLRDVASGAERVLVDLEGTVSEPTWSPDSRRLAFNYNRRSVTPTVNDIRIVTVATGQIRSLGLRGYPARWTTRGDIYFYLPNWAANVFDWWLVPESGGDPRKVYVQPVSGGASAAITQDGASLLMSRNNKLQLVDLATGAERPVTTGTAEEAAIATSPDQRLLLFASNPESRWGLYVVPLDRIPVSAPVRVAWIDQTTTDENNGIRHRWTPEGLLALSVTYREANVYRIAMDQSTGHASGVPERLTQDAPTNHFPVVSPDGRRIAYYYRNGRKAGIAVMDADGTRERPLVDQSGVLELFWRSPDELLFYDFSTPAGQQPAITSLNVETGVRQPVAQVDGLYWYYAPGQNLILHSHPGGGAARPGLTVRAYSPSSGTDRIVATIDNLAPGLAIAPDGRRFAYTVEHNLPDGTFECEVAIMTLDGVREKVLVRRKRRLACVWIPDSWSPDGRFLLLQGSGPLVANVETGETWPLRPDLPNPNEWSGGSWAPDGSYIVVSRSTTRTERLAWEGVTYDAVVRLMTGGGS